jgi:hypothetical protein
MRTGRAALVLVIAFLIGFAPLSANAQDASPVPATGQKLDLAAMALAESDVPDGYFDDYSEWEISGDEIPGYVLGGKPAPAGLERVYQSFYYNNDNGMAINNFLLEFSSAEQTAGAYAIFDIILRPPLPDGSTTGLTQVPDPDLPGENGMISIISYDTSAADGPIADITASSFTNDRVLAGVSVETYTDVSQIASPEAESSPVATSAAPRDIATQLANTLAARVDTVIAGGTVSGVDQSLPARVLPIGQLPQVPAPLFSGYKSGADLLRCGICDEENSLIPFVDQSLGGYSETVVVGPLVDDEATPPFVSIAISTFTSPEVALQVLEAIRANPDDRPTAGPIPRGNRTIAADPKIAGTDGSLAFQATSDDQDPEAPIDSAGVDFVVGTLLVTVDVQGGMEADAALAAAIDLATQQAACLTANGACGSILAPTELP